MREVVDIKIDPAILARFEALAEGSPTRAHQWTATEDAILLEYWPRKNKEAVAKQLGLDANTARKRYRELTA